MARTGVLLTGFGGPASFEDIRPFMCSLMGREPSDEVYARICTRYLTIGGHSPLNEIAGDIGTALTEAFKKQEMDIPVAVGMRYAPPFIDEALNALHEAGCDKVVAVSLSPFESKVAHGAYREAMDEASSAIPGLEIVEAPLVAELPEYAQFFALSTSSAITELEPNEGAPIVFTAHSLPVSDLVDGDPYVVGLERVANNVADQLGLGVGIHGPKSTVVSGLSAFGSVEPPRAWFLAYQSKGARGGEWLGPDLDEVIDRIVQSAANSVVVVPLGFMTDHLETLYDIDVEAAGRALDGGIEFSRAVVPNANEDLIAAIARMVISLA